MKNAFLNNVICLFSITLLFCYCKSSKSYTEDMKSELVNMYKLDQDLQTFNPKRLEEKSYIDSMNFEQNKLIRNNCEIVKGFFNKYSFPGIKENGKQAALHFWLLVQHSDHDVAFQEQVLNVMKNELKKENVDKRNYAYLVDRVLKNKGEKQIYGTQISWKTGKPLPLPLKYPEKVNEMRKEMQLEPIEDYLASFLE